MRLLFENCLYMFKHLFFDDRFMHILHYDPFAFGYGSPLLCFIVFHLPLMIHNMAQVNGIIQYL